METSYERPFRPISLGAGPAALEAFPLIAMADQLKREDSFHQSGRTALTLVHDKSLTVILTVARSGGTCDPHHEPGPTIIVPVSGKLRLSSSRPEKQLDVEPGVSVAVSPGVDHVIEAQTDAAFLTIIGAQ